MSSSARGRGSGRGVPTWRSPLTAVLAAALGYLAAMPTVPARTVALATSLVLVSSVACSIFAPSRQELLFESEPPGATVRVDGVVVGQTPVRAPVRKFGSTPVMSHNPPKVVYQLEGYREVQLRPQAQKVSPTGWLDILGVFTSVTVLTPGFWSFDKDRYTMTLVPEGAPNPLFDAPAPGPFPSASSPSRIAEEPRYAGGYNKKIAITIGIDAYDRWPPLEGGRRDAERVAARLKQLGFDEVIEVYDRDATRVRMLRLLGTELVSRSDPESLVLIYFAGHGQTETLANGERRGYIVPVDADTQDSFATAISMEKIRELSRRIPAKHLYYAMDSCYSGLGLTRGIAAIRPGGGNFATEATSRRAVQMLTAGGEGEQAIEVAGQGIFTTYLLEAMGGAADANADGFISASEIGAFVRPRVKGASKGRQNPQFGSLDGGGEIVFEVPRSPRLR